MLSLPGSENKELYVRGIFDSIAQRYDLMNSLMSFGMDKGWRKFTVECTCLKAGGKALDICCGTGRMTRELARTAGIYGQVIGLDFSENMLRIAQKTLNNYEYKSVIKFIQGNAMELPFNDNSFDTVTVGWGLRNVPDMNRVISEMMRVVKPGGTVVSIDMAKPELPVFKQLYWLYFEKLVPIMGRLWAKKENAYSYLHDSAKAFLHQRELAQLFCRVGLENVRYYNLSGGVVAVVQGWKFQ
jgi:demethylmenaquinone methyltransferase/2-methoxy-6-polyprenyl-1,4-benzoquinol methylase